MKFTLLLTSLALLLISCDDKPEPKPEPAPPAVTANFSAPENGEQTVSVSFQNQSQNATRYVWTFGDGQTGYEENPTHTYKAPGTYLVKLKAFSPAKVDSVSKSIVVSPYNIFTHVNLPFAGTYACKVVYTSIAPMYPTGTTRLPDEVISITKEAPNALLRNNTKYVYTPADPSSPQLPSKDGSYLFKGPSVSTWPSDISLLMYIHATGDSVTIINSYRYGASGGGSITKYYGIRRP